MIHKHLCTLDGKNFAIKYDQKKSKVTIGGDRKLQMELWRIYTLCFNECDGEPHFYEVVRGKTRLTFNCTFKNYQRSLGSISDEDYEIEDVDSLERSM